MKYYGRLSVIALLAIAPLYGFAQEKVVPIKYGDMDQWMESVRFMSPVL